MSFSHWPGSNASGRPSTRSNTNDCTLGASSSFERISMSNVSGVTLLYSYRFGWSRGAERFHLVCVADLHAREVAERVLHPQEGVAQVVARHASSRARTKELVDERGRVRRVKDDARHHRAAVRCSDDACLEQLRNFSPQPQHFVTEFL